MSETNSEIGARTLDQLEDLLATREREISALERATCAFGAMHHSGESIYYSLAQQAAGLLQAEVAFILLYEPEQQLLVGQSPAFGVTDEARKRSTVPSCVAGRKAIPGAGVWHDEPKHRSCRHPFYGVRILTGGWSARRVLHAGRRALSRRSLPARRSRFGFYFSSNFNRCFLSNFICNFKYFICNITFKINTLKKTGTVSKY